MQHTMIRSRAKQNGHIQVNIIMELLDCRNLPEREQ